MLGGSSRWGKEIWVAAVGSVKTACVFFSAGSKAFFAVSH